MSISNINRIMYDFYFIDTLRVDLSSSKVEVNLQRLLASAFLSEGGLSTIEGNIDVIIRKELNGKINGNKQND